MAYLHAVLEILIYCVSVIFGFLSSYFRFMFILKFLLFFFFVLFCLFVFLFLFFPVNAKFSNIYGSTFMYCNHACTSKVMHIHHLIQCQTITLSAVAPGHGPLAKFKGSVARSHSRESYGLTPHGENI